MKPSKSKSSSKLAAVRLDRRHNAIDLAIRFVLSLTYAICAGLYFNNAYYRFQNADIMHMDAKMLAQGVSVLAIGLYMLLIGCIYVLRLKPMNKFAGAWPCTAAILGGFLLSGLLLLNPRTDLPLSIQLLASLLVLGGNAFAVIILLRLGRSFSVLPEGRRLVTTGPYKKVRHPLYLAEAVATLGVLINFLSLWAILLVIVQIVLQLIRIGYEERVLHETFPEYAIYAKNTARLIPGIY